MDTITSIFWVVVAFSGYVFIHELGHFLAARRVGVRVEVFSLGFGPFLFTFRKGETLYAFSLVPLGGYVKMAGQNDLGTDPNTGKPYEYSSKPPFQRMQIAVAGVMMNFIGAYIAFTAAYMVGIDVVPAVARQVVKGSPADKAGIRPGERIIAVNGSPVRSFNDLQPLLVTRPGREAEFVIEDADGARRPVALKPETKGNYAHIGISPDVPIHIGADLEVAGAFVRNVVKSGPADEAGIEPNDILAAVDGEPVRDGEAFQKRIAASAGDVLVLEVRRLGALLELAVTPKSLKENAPPMIGIEFTTAYRVREVFSGGPAEALELAHGDVIAVEGITAEKRTKADSGRKLSLVARLERDGAAVSLKIPVDFDETRGMALAGAEMQEPLRLGPLDASVMGFYKTVDFTKLVLGFLRGLFTGLFKVGDLAGPVSVIKFTYQASQAGLGALLLLFGFVSVNLGVINLFPMPPFDGGLLLFLLYEKSRGRPLPKRVQEGFLLVGVVLLLMLVVLVTSNDISRLFDGRGM